jgi:4'-phosphopantetheinyl transferase EntD
MPLRDALTEDDVARMMDRAERAMASASRQQRSLGQDIERLLTERNRLLAIIAVLQSEDA